MKYLERAYPWILLSPVVLPVVVWNGLIYPYLVPKTLLFYVLSFTAIAVFALLVTHGRAFYWSRLTAKETWIPGALLLLAYVSSLYGIDFQKSFWSLFIRGDGLLMLTCVVSSFYLILLYADRAFFERLLRTAAVVGTFVAIWGIGEWFLYGGRIGGLLGNAAFFAGYVGITFFVTLAAARSVSRDFRSILFIGAGLQIIAIILTATRGTMLALIVAGGAFLVYQVFSGKGAYRTWAAYTLVALLALGGAFLAFRTELASSSFTPIARIASIGVHDPDVASRLFIWKNMVSEIQKAPLLGVGAEHIDTLFNRFYDPTQISEEWFDRSHNAFLDYAAQYGISGFVLYSALIAIFFLIASRLMRRGEKHIAGIFPLLAIVYAVQNFFVFDTVSSFWLLLALLAAFISSSHTESVREKIPLPAWMRYAAWLFVFALVFFVIPVSVRPILAAYDLAQAYKYQFTDVSKEAQYLSQGMALQTYGNLEYGYEAYDMYVHNQVPVLTGQARIDAYNVALTVLSENFNRYTYDARTALYLAHVLSLAPKEVPADHGLLSESLARTIRLSPKRSQAWYILANLAISNANTYPPKSVERNAGYAAAQDILTKYIRLVPASAAPHFVYAQLLFALGNVQDAKAEAEKGKVVYKPDVETARRAAGFYEDVHDWQNAKFFLNEMLKFSPSDSLTLYDLAKVTYLAGDPAGALVIVEKLRASNPEVLGTDQNFLSAITAYEARAGGR